MESFKYIAIWTLCSFTYGYQANNIRCGTSNKCFCIRNMFDIEFHCPDEDTQTINIKFITEYNTVRVRCQDLLNWNNEELPVLEIDDVEYFDIRMCPVSTNIYAIMNKLKVKNIKQLKVTHSKQFANITITSPYFEGLSNLETLILNYNDIKTIDKNAFTSLSELKELDLDHNKIESVDNLFVNFPKLKLLNLADNELVNLAPQTFQNLTELTHLSLSYNKLSTFDSDVFKHLNNLKLLQMRDLYVERFPENIFYSLENVRQVDLSMNRLTELPEALFKHNKLLEDVVMIRNANLTYLPQTLFSNLVKLKNVYLSECKLESLPSKLFEGSVNLQKIYLRMNQLEYIPEDTFNELEWLQELDLSYNKIKTLPRKLFSSLIQLKILSLEYNLLTNIGNDYFYNLQNLQILNLQHNRIGFVDSASFQTLINLKKLILANNCIDIPKRVSLFHDNVKLQTVDLSNNNITEMGNFTTLPKLQELDLSYNKISFLNINDIFQAVSPVYIKLDFNNITKVHFDEAAVLSKDLEELNLFSTNPVISLNKNPLSCDCHVYNFIRYINGYTSTPMLVSIKADNLICSSSNDFFNVPVTKLKWNMLTCLVEELGIKDRFTENCSYRFRPWDKTLVIDCSNSNFTEAPRLILPTQYFFDQTEVLLEGNLLTAGPQENTGYENVTRLSLSDNRITDISWIPPKLQILKIDQNNITHLNEEILTRLNSSFLTNITFGQNPWICDCSAVSLISFIQSKLSANELKIDANETTITCRDNGKLLVELRTEDICPSNMTLLLALTITFLLVALFVVLLMTFYFRYQEEVKVWLFTHKLLLWFVIKEEVDKDKLYDAFLSYSRKDEDFVLNELLPVLEQGPHPYKLYLHDRNTLAGEFIVRQIPRSVSESRRTIVILSRNFLESEWGKMECREAHLQTIREEGARLILVLYGEIDVNSELDDELTAYVRTNTYVKWGDPWFWDKLRYALPHSHVRSRKLVQKTSKVTIALNDRLNNTDAVNLINVTPSTPDAVSTPPANHLLLKNNPLKFP